jgi:hypothetical protein
MTSILSTPHSLPCNASADKVGFSLRYLQCTPEAKRRIFFNPMKKKDLLDSLATTRSAVTVYFLPDPVKIA